VNEKEGTAPNARFPPKEKYIWYPSPYHTHCYDSEVKQAAMESNPSAVTAINTVEPPITDSRITLATS